MTIKDIARESGYGVGTVSRVLNGQSDVSETAREAIMEVIRKYNFRPNSNAKQLKQHNSGGIAILVKGPGNMVFAGMLEKLQRCFEKTDRSVAVYYLEESDDEVAHALQVCKESKPLGIIFLGGSQSNFDDRFRAVTIPSILVCVPGGNLDFPNLSSVSSDDVEGTRCTMGYLLDCGHRNVGIIGGLHSYPVQLGTNVHLSQLRMLGCLQAHCQRGIPFEPEDRIAQVPYSVAGGYEGANTILDRSPEVTAILAMSDVMAIGAIRAIHDRNLRVPEDISVIGFDGIEITQYLTPRLTTVWQDTDRMASRTAEIMLSQMDKRRIHTHEIVPCRLIAGESVRTI